MCQLLRWSLYLQLRSHTTSPYLTTTRHDTCSFNHFSSLSHHLFVSNSIINNVQPVCHSFERLKNKFIYPMSILSVSNIGCLINIVTYKRVSNREIECQLEFVVSKLNQIKQSLWTARIIKMSLHLMSHVLNLIQSDELGSSNLLLPQEIHRRLRIIVSFITFSSTYRK